MAAGVIEFQNQRYRIRQELYQTFHFTVYELIDPIELEGTQTQFVAITGDGQR